LGFREGEMGGEVVAGDGANGDGLPTGRTRSPPAAIFPDAKPLI
jgi:hypothetical protein